ncbi:PepSY domain-containing protein [Rhodovulum sp. DZ06]|uniref:PepSY domain-containing protein n=1 Tax=Rhodovulum sp. DZ06 TaxID=3425126 RepID=UPI003D33CFC4
MRKFIPAAFALVLAVPAAASETAAPGDFGAIQVGAQAGATMQDVTGWLAAQGAEVRKSEMEDGKIEVYFVKDGKMGEIYVSTATGAVTKVKRK